MENLGGNVPVSIYIICATALYKYQNYKTFCSLSITKEWYVSPTMNTKDKIRLECFDDSRPNQFLSKTV